MAPESGPVTEPHRASPQLWRQRLGELRHDLRNPLSDILGFTEILVEEAREQNRGAMVGGLESIRQSANRILADVNHALNPNTSWLNPAVLESLNTMIREQVEGILADTDGLAAQGDPAQPASFAEDLVRVIGSARRLRELAPVGLENLIALGAAIRAGEAAGEVQTPADDPSRDTGSIGPIGLSGAILVADDQEANRALLSRRLQKRGYTVALAENGRQAMEQLRRRHFDLILLDIVMPEMDGMEVLRQVKADPDFAHIPVLMLSALDELDSVVRCIELGAEDYLPKPFPAAILHARVQACLANKRMSDQLRKYTGWLFGKSLFSSAVAAPGSLDLSRQQRTILFADIRGFTRWSETNTPEEAVTMLNCYFEAAEKIWRNSSVIKTEYTGDEIMGVFPAAVDAIRIAQALREQLGPILEPWWGLGIGVGVHTGPVIEGLMGGAEVKAYRFVGDTVNTAKRICTEAQRGQVLISDVSRREADTFAEVGAATEIIVKGKAEPLRVWPLLQIAC